MKSEDENKVVISVSVDPDLIEWIDTMVEKKIFSGRSHAVQACLFNYKEHMVNKK